MRYLKNAAVLLVLVFQALGLLGQKKFHVTIQIPNNIQAEKLRIEYDNGKVVSNIAPIFKDQQMIIEGWFYSTYVTLTLTYPETNNILFNNRFFISEKPASIVILETRPNSFTKNPLLNNKAINAIEIEKTYGAKKLAEKTKLEIEDIDKFLRKHGVEAWNNDSLRKVFDKKANKINDIKLDFIKKNRDLYYSFWLFRTEIVPLLNYKTPDTLLLIFNSLFSSKIKNSFEGFVVRDLLFGKAYSKNGYLAPIFTTKDISGNSIVLTDLRGKNVLLNFWASWCIPCITHIDELKKIRDTISEDKLLIISISVDTDSLKFSEAITKYKMGWINVFHDPVLINKYGNKPIPGLYLIDPSGKIIGNNFEDSDKVFFEKLEHIN